ncbi:MAG: hypothetical protein N2449_00090 [Bacteroidales bacterium]|nr:hypothetical protein [Bacteroidales bacterium]
MKTYLIPFILMLITMSCKKESPEEEVIYSYQDMNIEFHPKSCASSFDDCKQNFYFAALEYGELFSSVGGELIRMYYYKTGKNTATMYLINSIAGIKYEYLLTFKTKRTGNYECKLNNKFYAKGRFRIYDMHKF